MKKMHEEMTFLFYISTQTPLQGAFLKGVIIPLYCTLVQASHDLLHCISSHDICVPKPTLKLKGP